MTELEKVRKGLEICVNRVPGKYDCNECPYEIDGNCCEINLSKDALELLKEQDPVKPHYNARTNWYECGACHYSMTSGMHCRSELIPATKVRYCANCGFPVNWEGR